MWLPAQAALLLAGLLLPGAAVGRALGLPRSVALSFLGSALGIYVTIVGCQLLSIRVSLLTLAVGLGLIALGAWAAAPRRPETGAAPATEANDWLGPLPYLGPWAWLYGPVWAALVLRIWHQPLAGPDVEFRWSFLAEQLLAQGSLDFYPPRRAGDFLHYFWVESLPPGASALHAWAFACAGAAHAGWTAPAILLQVWSVHELVWRTTREAAGTRAARFACLAIAACPLLTWSATLGQETGLTALALVAIAFALQRWHRTREPQWAVLAGIAAALGAATREYGLVFPVLAAAGLLAGGADRRAWLGFAPAVAVGFVWPLRTWVLTGNPVYSLDVAGWFPVNARFATWLAAEREAIGLPLGTSSDWLDFGRYLTNYAPAAAVGWVWLAWNAARRSTLAGWAAGAVAALLTLWWVSVPLTNGGLFYSMRVLSPALALGCIAAGLALDCGCPPGSTRCPVVGALVGVLFAATLPATLSLPLSPSRQPDWTLWPAFRAEEPAAPEPLAAALTRSLAGKAAPEQAGLVLSDAPGFQHRFAGTGIAVIPLWSPQADALFDPALDAATAGRRWRESGITHLILTKWRMNTAFMETHSRWARPPFSVTKIAETPLHALYAISVRD